MGVGVKNKGRGHCGEWDKGVNYGMDGLSIVGSAYADQAVAVRSGETTGRATNVAAATERVESAERASSEPRSVKSYDSAGHVEKPASQPGQRINAHA